MLLFLVPLLATTAAVTVVQLFLYSKEIEMRKKSVPNISSLLDELAD